MTTAGFQLLQVSRQTFWPTPSEPDHGTHILLQSRQMAWTSLLLSTGPVIFLTESSQVGADNDSPWVNPEWLFTNTGFVCAQNGFLHFSRDQSETYYDSLIILLSFLWGWIQDCSFYCCQGLSLVLVSLQRWQRSTCNNISLFLYLPFFFFKVISKWNHYLSFPKEYFLGFFLPRSLKGV